MKCEVRVTREGSSWLADVPAVAGASTFAGNLLALDIAVREVLSLLLDVDDESSFELEYDYTNVDSDLLAAVDLGKRRAAIEVEQAVIAAACSEKITALARHGYSVRDISGVLHMSPGRVSQIAKASA
jgi:hypothetical protein